MNEHFSAEIARFLSDNIEVNEKSKNFLRLLHSIQFIALTNKTTKSINVYKSDPYEYPKASILFFKYDLDEIDKETLEGLGYIVTFHEKSPDYWLYGAIKNYHEISWK
jgi:hypothetical protein